MDFDKIKDYIQKNSFKEAIVLLNPFLKKHPSHADALYYRAVCYNKLKAYKKALVDLDLLIDRLPENAEFFYQRGIAHYHLENFSAALNDFDSAVKLEPDNAFRYSSRAYIKSFLNDNLGAIEDYKKAISLDPDDPILHNNLGLVEEKIGYHHNAQVHFKTADELAGVRTKSAYYKQENTRQKNYFSVIKSVFCDKNVRKEFFNFLKKKLSF